MEDEGLCVVQVLFQLSNLIFPISVSAVGNDVLAPRAGWEEADTGRRRGAPNDDQRGSGVHRGCREYMLPATMHQYSLTGLVVRCECDCENAIDHFIGF
jgi:hypothetical protein